MKTNDTPTKRRRGAQPGNLNARTHGAFLNDLKRQAGARRDEYQRRVKKEARKIVKGQREPLARMTENNLVRLQAIQHDLERHHTKRGMFDRTGALKASLKTEIQVIGGLIEQASKQLAALRGPGSGDLGAVLEIVAEVARTREAKRRRMPALEPGPAPEGNRVAVAPIVAPEPVRGAVEGDEDHTEDRTEDRVVGRAVDRADDRVVRRPTTTAPTSASRTTPNTSPDRARRAGPLQWASTRSSRGWSDDDDANTEEPIKW